MKELNVLLVQLLAVLALLLEPTNVLLAKIENFYQMVLQEPVISLAAQLAVTLTKGVVHLAQVLVAEFTALTDSALLL
jgi:hypothetical protein